MVHAQILKQIVLKRVIAVMDLLLTVQILTVVQKAGLVMDMKQFGCSRSVAKAHVKDWIGTGYLIQEWCKPLRNNGLKGH